MFLIRPMTFNDYASVIALMKTAPGVSLRDADSPENTARYLARNPDLSFVACIGARVVGCVMSGHDGRRGYLQHLVVSAEQRRQGIANALVANCLGSLEKIGIRKFHVDVLLGNDAGSTYWSSQGWQRRSDIERYSLTRSGGENA